MKWKVMCEIDREIERERGEKEKRKQLRLIDR